jgi:hypothetical protein
LIASTYVSALDWCRKVVRRYSARNSGRDAGFIFGVTNPIKKLSQQVQDEIDMLSKVDELEFFYGLGMDECKAHYANFQEHPVLVQRVYINGKGLSKELLASALPNEWTYPLERAENIIALRPDGGYTSWDEVAVNARLERDLETVQLEVPKNIEETAVRFF